jgi:hypothetical protein
MIDMQPVSPSNNDVIVNSLFTEFAMVILWMPSRHAQAQADRYLLRCPTLASRTKRHIAPAILSDPDMDVTVDLVTGEDGEPLFRRVAKDATVAERQEYAE